MAALELAFATKPLREVCESQDKATQKFGARTAAVLRDRLADLRAAASVEDLPLGKPRKAKSGYIIDLSVDVQIVIAPNHVNLPVLPSRTIDWSRVTRIKILGIEINT